MKVKIEAADLYDLIMCATLPVDVYSDLLESNKEHIAEMLQNNGLDYPSLEQEHEEYLSTMDENICDLEYTPTYDGCKYTFTYDDYMFVLNDYSHLHLVIIFICQESENKQS